MNKYFPVTAVFDELETPVGLLKIIASERGVHAIVWEHESIPPIARDKKHPLIIKVKQQLTEYFKGTRQQFDLPLAPMGTAFQLQAWQALRKIPYGKTISYGEQAKRLGDKNKARAVGMANGKNPISIVVPCHRVIGANGQLTGFGGGLENKAWLLGHEQKYFKVHDE